MACTPLAVQHKLATPNNYAKVPILATVTLSLSLSWCSTLTFSNQDYMHEAPLF